jgi:hypothetical protein
MTGRSTGSGMVRGIWGVWFHQDLERSAGLLRAYDLIYDTLSPEEAARIRAGVFDHQVKLVRRWGMPYTNMIGHHLIGLALFGRFLPEPEYMHEMVEHYENMMFVGFWPDGFFREVTPSYHTMPVVRMERHVPPLVDGYSDPEGYLHPETGRRIDNLNLAATYASHFDRWWAAWDKLTLPNRTSLVVNDATLGRTAWWTRRELNRTYPRLLGTSGIGVLGEGGGGEQLEAYLVWAGTHGHEHRNVLDLIWWAHGREVFSSTNYRPLPESDSTREWHTMSAGHNLVVIDGVDQHGRSQGNQRELSDDDALRGLRTWRHRNLSMNHGNPLLFDPTWDEVQVMEAEGERAYSPRADQYRRTLAMVSLGDGDGYLLDIFRVRGGSVHDYILHGGLDHPYQVTHTAVALPVSGREHKYIELTQRAPMMPGDSFTFTYEDGVATTSRLVAPTAPDTKGIEGARLLIGEAPAMRRVGRAPFVILRREGEEALARPGSDNTFVLVHEVHRGKPRVKAAELLELVSDDPEAIAVRIALADGREDVFVSTLGEGQVTLADGRHFHGRLGYWRQGADEQRIVRVFDGFAFRNEHGEGVTGLEPFSGEVMGTLRKDAGDQADGLIVSQKLSADGSLDGRTVMVDFRGEMTWAYRVTGIEPRPDGSLVHLEHDPGFEIREEDALAKMLFYPGWGFRSDGSETPATWYLPVAGHWDSH